VTRLAPVRAIVTDIEGTTTSLAFVHEVLFPYARRHLRAFVAERAEDPQVAQLLAQVDPDSQRALAQLEQWMDQDRKATPLKTLQGLLWAQGYATGELRGHVYPDAAHVLARLHAAGIALYVYSSGSIAAQRLIFGHSDHGDLTPLFADYFDTTTGPKTEPDSYRNIARAIAADGGEILFLSDNPRELSAAADAGWHVAQILREGVVPDARFPQAKTFEEIEFASHEMSGDRLYMGTSKQPIAKKSAIPPGTTQRVVTGDSVVLLCNVAGEIYAVEDLCTHDGGALDQGLLEDCRIMCPRHGAYFDVTTGAALTLPAITPLQTYPTHIEGDDIFVEM
jgi:enolase-phosphatase E1